MNFCFVYNELLSASSQPGATERISSYLALFRENNIKVLISLHKDIELPAKYKSFFTTYYFPIPDYETPDLDYLDKIAKTAIKHIKKDEPVNVNCAAGIGRSGTILVAILMKYKKMKYEDALEIVRKHRYAVETDEQEEILKEYEERIFNNNKKKSA